MPNKKPKPGQKLIKFKGSPSASDVANVRASIKAAEIRKKNASAVKKGAEGPKRSTAKPKRMPIKKASARSGLRSKTTTGVTMAQVQKTVADALSNIPGIQDRNSAANRQWRISANRTLGQARAQEGAKKSGNSARSQMAVTRSRRVRWPKSNKK
jgi:hypothetical protein